MIKQRQILKKAFGGWAVGFIKAVFLETPPSWLAAFAQAAGSTWSALSEPLPRPGLWKVFSWSKWNPLYKASECTSLTVKKVRNILEGCPGVCANSGPLLYYFLLGVFAVGQLFTAGGQRVGASASASDLPTNIQGWFPLRLTGLISMLSKELSRVFSSSPLFIHQPISLARLEVPQVTGMGLVTTLDYPIVHCTCYTCLLDKEINEWMIFEKNISGSFTLAGKINEHALSL